MSKNNTKLAYHTDDAYGFYRTFIFNEAHQELLAKNGFRIAGSVHPINWELFSAILTGDNGKEGYGSDLNNYEVKSSVQKGSFEYQYHFHGGQDKLKDDIKVDHIFISYSPDYKNIEVRLVQGKLLKDTFLSWTPGLVKNYSGPNRRQRYRKSVPYGLVKESGVLLMKTRDGNLV